MNKRFVKYRRLCNWLIVLARSKQWVLFNCLAVSILFTGHAVAQSIPAPLPEAYIGSAGNEVLLSLTFDDKEAGSAALALTLAESSGVASNVKIVERKDLSSEFKRFFAVTFDIAPDVEPGSEEKLVFVPSSNQLLTYDRDTLQFSFRAIMADQKEGPGGDDPRILKLVDIQWETPPTAAKKSGVVSRAKNEAGFSVAYEKKSAATAENYGIGFTKYPLEIVTGEPFEVSFEGFLGQSTRYRCTTPGWKNNKPYVRAKFIARGDHDIAVHEIFSASNEVLICPANSVELSVEDQHQSLIQVKAVFTPMEGEQRKNERVESTHYTYTTAIVGEGEAWDSGGERKILIYWRDDPEKENKGTKPEKKSGSLTLTLQGFDPADGVVRLIYRSVSEGESTIADVTAYLRPEVPPLMVDPDVQAAPKEEYGIYLLKQGNALWVGPASELTGKAAGDFTYGGPCRDPKQCPVEPTRLKGLFATQEQVNTAFCADYKGGRYVLGVNWVFMSYGNFGAARVPRCSGDPRSPVTSAGMAGAGSGHRDEVTVPEPNGTDRTEAAGLSGSEISRDPGSGKAALSPDNPDVKKLIKAWLGKAEPLANAQGADLRFDKWGRVEGRAVGGIITLTGSPDDVAGRSPEKYVWANRGSMDSINLCKLEEYVVAQIKGEDISYCRDRKKEVIKSIVPEITGRTAQEAKAITEKAGLIPELEVGEDTLDPKKEGIVYKQIPSPSTELEPGSRVTLLVHTLAGNLPVVPDVIGIDAETAFKAVTNAGLKPELEVGEQTGDRKKENTVYNQSPAPGSTVEAGSNVVIKIYTYTEISLKVPQLIGLPLLDAKRDMEKTGLKISVNLEGTAPKKSDEGRVSKQKPGSGSNIKEGAVVEVWVYGEYVEVVQPVKPKGIHEKTTTEYCALGKANFPYQPDREYYVFRGREPRKYTSGHNSREYKFLPDNARNAQAAVRQIQQEGKMELIFTGKLPGLCPHLRENCAYSTLNHADGSFFGDICGKWEDPAPAYVNQDLATIPDLRGMTAANAQKTAQDIGMSISVELGDAATRQKDVNLIYKQSPEPGMDAADGSSVTVWVYGEANQNIEPSPAGQGGLPQVTVEGDSTGTRLVLEKVIYSKYQAPEDLCKTDQNCRHTSRVASGVLLDDYFFNDNGRAVYRFKETYQSTGDVLSDYTAEFFYNIPPSEIHAGDTLVLNISGTARGDTKGWHVGRRFTYYIKQHSGNNYFDKTDVYFNIRDLPKDGQRYRGSLSKQAVTRIPIPKRVKDTLVIGGRNGQDPAIYVDWVYRVVPDSQGTGGPKPAVGKNTSSCDLYAGRLNSYMMEQQKISSRMMSDPGNSNSYACNLLKVNREIIELAKEARASGCKIDGNLEAASKQLISTYQQMCK